MVQSSQFKISGLLQPFLVPKPHNLSETIRTSLQQVEWVTSIDFKDAYSHIPIQEQSRKYLRFHIQGSSIRFAHSTHGVHCDTKGGKTDGYTQGFKHPPVPRLVGESQIPPGLSPTYTGTSKNVSTIGLAGELREIRAGAQTRLRFVGYQFDLRSGRVRLTPDQWQNLQQKILKLLSLPACPVREFMPLIGLLSATEKQVHLGRLHIRPSQWHHWKVPESLEKVIPITRSLHPHLQWWLKEDNVLTGQPLHPI